MELDIWKELPSTGSLARRVGLFIYLFKCLHHRGDLKLCYKISVKESEASVLEVVVHFE